MADIFDNTYWSQVDSNNNMAAPNGFPEGMAAGLVNNSARAIMGATKRWYDKANATMTTGGAANAYTLTPLVPLSSYTSGEVFVIVSNHANTGAATLDISGLGVKSITKNSTDALDADDINSGQIITLVYDGSKFQLITPAAPAAYTHPSDGVDLGAALTGASVISDVNVNTAGHVTGFATRALTPANIGALDLTGGTLTGSLVIDGYLTLSSADISAAGTTQGTATALTKTQSRITSITSITAASAEAVVLPAAATGMMIIVYNDDAADTLKIFPAAGATIDGNALNASIDLGIQSVLKFHAISSTVWLADYGVYG